MAKVPVEIEVHVQPIDESGKTPSRCNLNRLVSVDTGWIEEDGATVSNMSCRCGRTGLRGTLVTR